MVILPSAIEGFAKRLTVNRAKLELASNVLDDLGELQGLLREIAKGITVRLDGKGRLHLAVENWLDPFSNPEVQPTKVNRDWGAYRW